MNAAFDPIFIVGFPRSGTTLLATFLDRHSKIAIPPETSFFLRFFQRELTRAIHANALPRGGKIENAMHSLGLDYASVWTKFVRRQPCPPTELLMILLEDYAHLHNKPRFGEKSPWHLLSVPTIMSSFPAARVIGIVRDGRDAVLSLSKTPFGSGQDIRLHCLDWNRAASLFDLWSKRYSRFMWIRYEDLVREPLQTLARVCDFTRVVVEPQQISPETPSFTFAVSKEPWKEKASELIDPSRALAWQSEVAPEVFNTMTALMSRELSRYGYDPEISGDTSLPSVMRHRCEFYYISLVHAARRVIRRVQDLAWSPDDVLYQAGSADGT